MLKPTKPGRRFLSAAVAVALLGAPVAAGAQTAAPAATAAPGQTPAPGMTPQEAGGLNCLLFGAFAAAGVYVYSDVIMVAVTGYVNPTLLIPSMAAGFVAGCGVANTVTPALLFLGRRVF